MIDFGLFIRVDVGKAEKNSQQRNSEGLVHVSQIRWGRQMLERAHDAGFEKGDWVWAKLTQIRNDGKLNFSIKEVDQNNGQDLNQEHTDKLV